MKKILKIVNIFTIFALIFINFAFFTNINNIALGMASSFNSMSSAKAMVVLEKTTGRVLYQKNIDEKLPMASTTKIITAIFVIEKESNLDRIISIPKQAVGIEGTSIGLIEEEHLSIKELLYGLMLRSGNDAAVALALSVCNDMNDFKSKINQFVKKIGALNTHLENPHGLPNDNHYTTAHDLAIITSYALKNPIFQEIVSTKKVEISNELKSKFSRVLVNKNKLLNNFEYADGVKTGYTQKAGRCFVGSATQNGMQLICVLLNCGPMFEECQSLLKKGFNEFKMFKVLSKGQSFGTIKVKNSDTKNIDLISDQDYYYPLKNDEINKVKIEIIKPKNIKPPIMRGQIVASLNITLENQLIFSHKFYTIKAVESNTYKAKLNKILEGM